MSRSRFTLLMCLVAIVGGLAVGLMPLGFDSGSGTVDSDQTAAVGSQDHNDSGDRDEAASDSDRSSSTTRPTGTDLPAAPTAEVLSASAEAPAPGEVTAVTWPRLPSALDWFRRPATRKATTPQSTSDWIDGADGAEPEQAPVEVAQYWGPPLVWIDELPIPVRPSEPSGPPSTDPPPPDTTTPPPPDTTSPPVTEPEVPTTVPEVPTTLPEVPPTLPEEPVDPPVDPPAP